MTKHFNTIQVDKLNNEMSKINVNDNLHKNHNNSNME